METFTVRGATKWVVRSAIALKVTSLAKDAMVDYTALEEDSIAVKLGSKVIGSFVSTKLAPYSDKIVDKTADYVVAKRAKKDTEEDTPETTED
jgi:hypothetical protein